MALTPEPKGYERLSPREIPAKIVSRMTSLRDTLVASRKVAWIKITSGAGLTLTSNPNIPTFWNSTDRYNIHGGGDPNNSGLPGSATVGVSEDIYNSTSTNKFGLDVSELEPNDGLTFRPRPIVESIEVKNGKHGLSKKATVNIKCFTIKQLEIIARHFMEPAFTVIIQWGWNDGTGGIISGEPANFAKINNFPVNQTRKINAACAYENFLGIITGGSIAIDGETFNLTMEATGIGELSMNLQMLNDTSCEEDPANSTPGTTGWLGWVKDAWKGGKQMIQTAWTAVSNYWEVATLTDYSKEPFLNMYGALPAELQTASIKALEFPYQCLIGFNESALEEMNRLGVWGSLSNFFGFGPSGATLAGVNIGDETLVDGERFIRFNELIRIVETLPYNLKKGLNLADGGNVSLRINTEWVPITAHKRIFSTDKSKLVILGQNVPDFGLEVNFTDATRNPASVHVEYGNNKATGTTTPVQTNPTVDIRYVDLTNYLSSVTANPDINVDATHPYIEFPSTVPLQTSVNGTDYAAERDTWGWLHNLYINFDFAMDVLKRPGILAKDALLEMLNGMSSAVNNLWDFQVVESLDNNGNLILSVVDMNFNRFEKPKFPTFYSTGVKSVFKELSMNFDIPAAMKNQIIAKRASVEKTTPGGINFRPKLNPHLPPIHPTLWGSNLEDKIYTFIEKGLGDPCNTAATQPSNPSTTPSDDELIAKNALEFIKKAGIYLKHYDPAAIKRRNGNAIQLVQTRELYVATYSDTAILDSIRGFDTTNTSGGLANTLGPLLPVNVNFTVMGIGGFEFGHSFKLGDTLEKFRDTGIFQISEITHNVNGNTWETTVEARFRPTHE